MNNRILIVDDDRNTLEIMAQTLAPYYEVQSAGSAAEALRLLRPKGAGQAAVPKAAISQAAVPQVTVTQAAVHQVAVPDLILLDIDMPGMNGYEMVEQLSRDKALMNIPVVFLTGLTDEQAEMKGLSKNALDYLKKPVGMRVLLMRVQHYLNLIAARKETGTLDRKLLSNLPERLTDREQDVADLMAQFRSDREISEMLNISMPYTKKLVSAVKEKLGLEKRGDIRKYLK